MPCIATVEAVIAVGLTEQILLLMEVHIQATEDDRMRTAGESEVIARDEDFGRVCPGPGCQIVVQTVHARERDIRNPVQTVLGEQFSDGETRGPLIVTVQGEIQWLISPTCGYLVDGSGANRGRQLSQIQLGVVFKQRRGGGKRVPGPQVIREILVIGLLDKAEEHLLMVVEIVIDPDDFFAQIGGHRKRSCEEVVTGIGRQREDKVWPCKQQGVRIDAIGGNDVVREWLAGRWVGNGLGVVAEVARALP